MKFNRVENQNLTPEQIDLQKQRDAHEKQAGKDAKNVNTFKENITNTGVKKMDILHADALLEDEQRKRVHNVDMDEEYPSRQEELLKKREGVLEVIQNSMVTTRERTDGSYSDDMILEGVIKGKKVKIGTKGIFWEGSIDGEEISPDLAQEIYYKYAHVGAKREDQIQDLHYNLPQYQEEKERIEREKTTKSEKEKAELLKEKKKYEDLL